MNDKLKQFLSQEYTRGKDVSSSIKFTLCTPKFSILFEPFLRKEIFIKTGTRSMLSVVLILFHSMHNMQLVINFHFSTTCRSNVLRFLHIEPLTSTRKVVHNTLIVVLHPSLKYLDLLTLPQPPMFLLFCLW